MFNRTWTLVCLASLLVACGPKPAIVKETQFVDRVVETQVALDPRLTTTRKEPAPPPAKCVVSGFKVPCGRDVANYIDELRTWGRGMHKQLAEIAGLQPKKEAK